MTLATAHGFGCGHAVERAVPVETISNPRPIKRWVHGTNHLGHADQTGDTSRSALTFTQGPIRREFFAAVDNEHARTIASEFIAQPTTKPTSAVWRKEGECLN